MAIIGVAEARDDGTTADGRVYVVAQGTFLGAGLTFRTRFITPGPEIAVFARPEFSTTESGDTFSWDFYEDPTFTNTGPLVVPEPLDRSQTRAAETIVQTNPNASAFGTLLDSFPALNQGQTPNRDFFYWRLKPETEYLSLITNVTVGLIVPLPRWRLIEVDL